jgi:hypothetical protein
MKSFKFKLKMIWDIITRNHIVVVLMTEKEYSKMLNKKGYTPRFHFWGWHPHRFYESIDMIPFGEKSAAKIDYEQMLK